jgi:hypothetical protein
MMGCLIMGVPHFSLLLREVGTFAQRATAQPEILSDYHHPGVIPSPAFSPAGRGISLYTIRRHQTDPRNHCAHSHFCSMLTRSSSR